MKKFDLFLHDISVIVVALFCIFICIIFDFDLISFFNGVLIGTIIFYFCLRIFSSKSKEDSDDVSTCS